jgi:hypothetical protein
MLIADAKKMASKIRENNLSVLAGMTEEVLIRPRSGLDYEMLVIEKCRSDRSFA